MAGVAWILFGTPAMSVAEGMVQAMPFVVHDTGSKLWEEGASLIVGPPAARSFAQAVRKTIPSYVAFQHPVLST